MARRTGGTGAFAFVLLALAAGCGQEAGTSATRPEPGPAEVYLEAVTGFSGDDESALTLRFEEIVAACMLEQGFEYVPYVEGHVMIDEAAIDPPPGSRAFAEQFGYGFAAAPEGMRFDSTGGNPNEAITAAMSPEAFDSYVRALWGDDAGEASSDGASDGESDGDMELGGCFRQARNEVFGDRETDHVRAGLEDEIARIDAEAAPTDPQVMAAAAEWSECMADAGHPGYASPAAAEQVAWDAWIAFNEGIAADPTLGATDAAGGIAGEGDLAAREASLATADWDCRADTGYDAAWSAARDRLQQEYVDAHRAELDAWVEERA